MFHRSVDVPLLSARESTTSSWRRVWYASAIFCTCICVTLGLGYAMDIYRRRRFSPCEKQIATLSGLDLGWFYMALVFCHYTFQHHKIRMLVGEILGLLMIPLFALTVDTLDRCKSYKDSEPLYSWLFGWASCTVLIVSVALVVWTYTLTKWCCFPKGLRITWQQTDEVHSGRSSMCSNVFTETESVDNGISSSSKNEPQDNNV